MAPSRIGAKQAVIIPAHVAVRLAGQDEPRDGFEAGHFCSLDRPLATRYAGNLAG